MTQQSSLLLFAKFLAFITGSIAIIIMWGWYSHNEAIVQIQPNFTPMKFNTALSLLFCSIAMATWETKYKNIGAVAALSSIVFNIITLLQYPLHKNFGVDTFFIEPFTVSNSPMPGRMSPNTAVGLIMLSLALLLCSQTKAWNRKISFSIALISSMVVSLGMVPLIGYLSGIDIIFSWSHYTRMAAHTAASLVVIGSFITIYAWSKTDKPALWLPIPVFLGLLTVAISLSTAIRNMEDIKFRDSMQSEAEHISIEGEARMVELYAALDRIANRWNVSQGTSEELWKSDTYSYLKSYPFLKAIARTDEYTTVQWLSSNIDAKTGIGFTLKSEPTRAAAIEKVMKTHKSHVTNTLTLLTGEKGFLYISPLYKGNKFDGVQTGAFVIDNLFKTLLKSWKNTELHIMVTEQGKLLYTNMPNKNLISDKKWFGNAELKNDHVSWIISVSPTEEMLAAKRSLIPLITLAVGAITSLLVSLCIYLTLKWKYNADNLRELSEKLEEINSFNNTILSSTSHMIVAVDLNGQVMVFNKAGENMLGYKAEEIINKHTPDLWHDKEEEKARAEELSEQIGQKVNPGIEAHIKRTLIKGTDKKEWIFVRKDGSKFPVELTTNILMGANDQHIGFMGVAQDITERKHAQEQQDVLIKKLVDSNEELERFAYVASHDMQEPLRMISSFSKILYKEYHDKFDEEGQEYLHFMTDGAVRMQAIISDLLEYARIGNEGIRFVKVEAMTELKHVKENLATIIEETGAVITSDELPEIVGNRVQFMRLLQNLVGNGLKYQAEGVTPKIHVGVQDNESEWIFSVKDNGIGMSAKYLKTIFEPFKRLHTWEEYTGTGIGLAVCKKIVENHRGKIGVMSQLGVGSQFNFSIPKHIEDEHDR